MKKKQEYIFEHNFNSNISIRITAYSRTEAVGILKSLVSNIMDYRLDSDDKSN